MDDTGTVLGGDVVSREDLECFGVVLEVGEWWLVGQADQVGADVSRDNRGVLTEFAAVRLHQWLSEQEFLADEVFGPIVANLNTDVGDLGVDGQRQVGRQRPWRRRPGQSVGADEGVVGTRIIPLAGDRHSDGQGWVLAHLVGVVQAGFLIRQWGVLCPGVRQHAEALVN